MSFSRTPMPLNELIMIAAPCPVSWDTMAGNDRVRFCSGCSKNVYNLSDMSNDELESFLREKGDNECIRLFRRTDGKIMTDNCPRALRAVRNKYRAVMRIAASVLASLFAFAQAGHAQNAATSNRAYSVTTDKDGNRYVMPKEPYPGAWAAGGPMPMRIPAGQPLPKGAEEPVQPVEQKPKIMVPSDNCPKSTAPSEAPRNGDLTAFNVQMQAKKSEEEGRFLVAHTQYIKAIEIAKKQAQSDPKYVALLFHELNALRQKMGLPALESDSELQKIKVLY